MQILFYMLYWKVKSPSKLSFRIVCVNETLKQSKIQEQLLFCRIRGLHFYALCLFSVWPCDVLLTSAPGEFASPSWPDNYPPNTRCSWRLTAPAHMRVRVRFETFELEQHTLGHCNDNYDHLVILDGGTVSAPKIGLYCGKHTPFVVRYLMHRTQKVFI